MQLELQSQEMLAKHWRHLAKREAKAVKAAKEAGTAHVPAAQTPEATFLPLLLADFLQVSLRRCTSGSHRHAIYCSSPPTCASQGQMEESVLAHASIHVAGQQDSCHYKYAKVRWHNGTKREESTP